MQHSCHSPNTEGQIILSNDFQPLDTIALPCCATQVWHAISPKMVSLE